MEGRSAAGGGTRGGGTIPAIRADVAYLLTGFVAAALLAAVGANTALTVAVGGGWVAGGAAAGVVLLVLGIALGRGGLADWGVGLVGAAYVASLFVRPQSLDQSGVLYAAALLASAELSSWSIDSRRRGLDDLTVHIHRLRAIALVLAVGIGLAAVVEAAASFGGGGTFAAAVASAAVVAAVAGTCAVAWRAVSRQTR